MFDIIYSPNLLKETLVDEMFLEESIAFKDAGFNVGTYKSLPKLAVKNEFLLYRGWMLNEQEYNELEEFAHKYGYKLITSKENYYKAHYIDNWIDLVKEKTPETFIFKSPEEYKRFLSDKNDKLEFFLKDSVKSLTTKRGSIALVSEVEDVFAILSEKRGIENSYVLRKVHDFISDSEIRYFCYKGKVFSPNEYVSPLAIEISNQFPELTLFSIDIIRDSSGKEWLVEIGDGQVSDLKMWKNKKFVNIFL